MTTATMTAADPDFDRDNLTQLLDLSARIVRGYPEDWRTLVEAFRPAATVDQRVAALLLLAGPLTDLTDDGDIEVLLRAFLPRLSADDRARALADMREELEQAQRFADMTNAGDLYDALDMQPGSFSDWVRVAEDETAKWRDSARHIAEQAVTR